MNFFKLFSKITEKINFNKELRKKDDSAVNLSIPKSSEGNRIMMVTSELTPESDVNKINK